MGKNCRFMRFQFTVTTIAAFHLRIVNDNKCYLVGSSLDQITVADVWPQRGTKTVNNILQGKASVDHKFCMW